MIMMSTMTWATRIAVINMHAPFLVVQPYLTLAEEEPEEEKLEKVTHYSLLYYTSAVFLLA